MNGSLIASGICKLLGHSWRLLSERWNNPNRHDKGGRREWYCIRCLTTKETRVNTQTTLTADPAVAPRNDFGI